VSGRDGVRTRRLQKPGFRPDRRLSMDQKLDGQMQPHNAVNTTHHFSSSARVRSLMGLATLIMCRCLSGQEANNSEVLTCDTATNARIGQPGVTYSGSVSNGDYRFDATIPEGLVGLGSAPGAPFHGFAIFVAKSSCIVFLVEHHVFPLPDDTPAPRRAPERWVPVRIGNRRGVERSTIGTTHGTRYLNTSVLLQLRRHGYKNDVSITFVTPVENRHTTEPVFREFLASFKFW